MGAWIETPSESITHELLLVAPRVGAWIETFVSIVLISVNGSRTPCGCVD